MALVDLNGNCVKYVEETNDLKEKAEALLFQKLDEAITQVLEIKIKNNEFSDFCSILDLPIKEFITKIEEIRTIISTGKLSTITLGIIQEEDYTDARKDLLKEAMYYIDNQRGE